MKFDGANTDRQNPSSSLLRSMAGLQTGELLFVAGSTQAPEERIVLEAFAMAKAAFPKLRLVLVPRHPERASEVAELLQRSGMAWVRRTDLDGQAQLPPDTILLVDTVGELSGWWGCADIGFVGGSLGSRGGQNMLEPSGFGVATCFGPNTRNFRDVVEMLVLKQAVEIVQDSSSLGQFVVRCAQDEFYREELGNRAQKVVIAQRGAVDKTTDLLRQLFVSNAIGSHRRFAA